MDNIKSVPPIEEFLKIYPKVLLKIENNEKDKLIKYFNIKYNLKKKRSSIILDENQIKKLLKDKNNIRASSINLENKEILSIQRINIHKELNQKDKASDKVLYRISQQDEDVDKYVDKLNEDFYLINKGLELQKRNLKRTHDVKKALEIFFENSELIQKVSKNYGINSNINPLKDKNVNEKIRDRIRKFISNLADNVLIEQYEKDKFIIRKNDIGKDCYFLLSGRVSILKPVEYKYLKITYEEYLKYLLNLRNNNEKKLFEAVTNINWNFMKIYNEETLMEIIKYYIQKRISFYSNISYDLEDKNIIEDLSLENIEAFINEYSLTFEDFGLSREKIVSDIKEIESKENENENKIQYMINNYFKDIFKITKKMNMLYNSYDFIFQKIETEKYKLVTLYKYETFLILSPGALFGEMSLDSENKIRNASVRTESNCIVVSLSIEKYANYLSDENRKILTRHINFLCNNFFFNNISQKIFTKYYFPIFKLKNIIKDNIIYSQESPCNSIYFLMDGSIKYEITASIIEIHNLIKFLISGLNGSKDLKLNNNIIKELISEYIKYNQLINIRNANIILSEKVSKVKKFELSISESYEVLGLTEFYFDLPHICSCTVISQNVRLFEISRTNLNYIISYEKVVKEDLNKLVVDKIIAFIKRLFNVENIFINNVMEKIDSNFFEIYDTAFFNNINYEKFTALNGQNKNNLKNSKDVEKNEKANKQNGDLILIKQFSKVGYIDDIKNISYSPVKHNKQFLNQKLISEIKDFNSPRPFSIINLGKIYDENKLNKEQDLSDTKKNKNQINKSLIINKFNKITDEKQIETKEKIITKDFPKINILTKFFQEKNNNELLNSNINNNEININDNTKIDLSQETFINIGKSYISLPKLRNLILKSGKPKKDFDLSIVRNKTDRICQKADCQKNNSLIEIENINNQINNNEQIPLPKINRQISCNFLPIKRKIIKKINKSIEFGRNKSENNIHENKSRSKNILAKYIKNFYFKQRIKGYTAFLNPKNNTLFKKKLNKNILNLVKI